MSNIIRTIAPLKPDLYRQYLMDKTITFEIDLANSLIKGKALLTFLANMNLPFTFYVDETVSKETRFETLQSYMTSNLVVEDPTLAAAMINVMLTFNGIPTNEIPNNPFIKQDELIEFCTLQHEKLVMWKLFLDSIPLYVMSCHSEFAESEGVAEHYEQIDDIDAVGRNIVNLLKYSDFVTDFVTISGDTPVAWFVKQFGNDIYYGKNLFHYLSKNGSELLFLMQKIVDCELPLMPDEESIELLRGYYVPPNE